MKWTAGIVLALALVACSTGAKNASTSASTSSASTSAGPVELTGTFEMISAGGGPGITDVYRSKDAVGAPCGVSKTGEELVDAGTVTVKNANGKIIGTGTTGHGSLVRLDMQADGKHLQEQDCDFKFTVDFDAPVDDATFDFTFPGVDTYTVQAPASSIHDAMLLKTVA